MQNKAETATCSDCNTILIVSESHGGKMIFCPTCRTTKAMQFIN